MFIDTEGQETQYCESCLELQKNLEAKEQECEELKREIAFGNNGELSDKIRAIVFKDLNAENSKYKQALDEIEENIKAMNNECFYDDICECNNCDMKNGCTYYRKFNILNIINKAKGGVNGNT